MLDHLALKSTFINSSMIDITYASLLAFLLGVALAVTYVRSFNGLSYSRGFLQALIFAPLLTAVAMQAIGDNVARGLGTMAAFSLSGMAPHSASATAKTMLRATALSASSTTTILSIEGASTRVARETRTWSNGLSAVREFRATPTASSKHSRSMRRTSVSPPFSGMKSPRSTIAPPGLASLLREGAGSRTAFNIAFAKLANVEFYLVQRTVAARDLDTVALLCRGAGFDRALYLTIAISLKNSEDRIGPSAQELGALYETVPVQAAQRALRFWKARTAA